MIIITVPPEKFSGKATIPGDKSITHRAVMLGAISHGITEVRGYLDAEDTFSTIRCLQMLGVRVTARGKKLLIYGRGMNLTKPVNTLDAGNSGTTARLLMGILAGQGFKTVITGDQSLQKRPMKRVVEPLSLMGAVIEGAEGEDVLPLTIEGGNLQGIDYKSPRASAQVKSAVLLAGLYAEGKTVVEEPSPSRNHTELMLARFGADIESTDRRVTLKRRPGLRGSQVMVPGDISAAAFIIAAATIIPDSEVYLKNIGVNQTRSGIIDALKKMGASIELKNKRHWGNEPVADILVRSGTSLQGISIGGDIIPRLIDEIPVIAVVAAVAEGKTVISDAQELRVKEADRITELCVQLAKMNVDIRETKDGMFIEGGKDLVGSEVESCGDHRIAMALAVAGMVAGGETAVHDAEIINISFPGFMPTMRSLIV